MNDVHIVTVFNLYDVTSYLFATETETLTLTLTHILTYPDGGYPTSGTPPVAPGWGVPRWGVPEVGYPAHRTWPGGGYPTSYRITDGVLDTPRSVCLLRSRRKTFLFVMEKHKVQCTNLKVKVQREPMELLIRTLFVNGHE